MKPTSNYTPGPWHYGITSECIITPRGEEIAGLANSDLTEKEDNARLIASAPALVEALEGLASLAWEEDAEYRHSPSLRAKVEKARAVLAAVKGGESK